MNGDPAETGAGADGWIRAVPMEGVAGPGPHSLPRELGPLGERSPRCVVRRASGRGKVSSRAASDFPGA